MRYWKQKNMVGLYSYLSGEISYQKRGKIILLLHCSLSYCLKISPVQWFLYVWQSILMSQVMRTRGRGEHKVTSNCYRNCAPPAKASHLTLHSHRHSGVHTLNPPSHSWRTFVTIKNPTWLWGLCCISPRAPSVEKLLLKCHPVLGCSAVTTLQRLWDRTTLCHLLHTLLLPSSSDSTPVSQRDLPSLPDGTTVDPANTGPTDHCAVGDANIKLRYSDRYKHVVNFNLLENGCFL